MKNGLFLLGFLVSVTPVFAQNDTKGWSPSVQLDFTTVPTMSITGVDTAYQNSFSYGPIFDFRSSGGFGLSYSPMFVAGGNTPGIFMHKVTVGLEKYGQKKFDVVADYSHFFFTGNRSIPVTPIKNEVLLAVASRKLWVNPKISAGVGFGKDSTSASASAAYDIELSGGVSHTFKWNFKNSDLNFIPSLLLDGGTNQYFSFLALSKFISHGKRFNKIIRNVHSKNARGRNSGSGTSSGKTTQKLYISNLEINAESTWETGSLSIRPSGSIFIPTNASSGGLSGYWEVNITYYF